MEGENKNRKRAREKGNRSGRNGSKGNNGVMEQQKRRELQIKLEICGEKNEDLHSIKSNQNHRMWWEKKPGKKGKIFAGFSSGAMTV